MRKEKVFFLLLLIVAAAMVYSIWSFQGQLNDAKEQTFELQNQLAYYENLTSTLQAQVNNLEAQLSDLQNPIYNVTIIDVSSTSWGNPVGMALLRVFSITIKNIGDRAVGGLTTEFKILADGNITDNDDFEITLTHPEQLGVLHVQESTVIKVEVMSSYYVSFAGKSLVVTLMLDKTVLDERTLSLSLL
jgi:hypothetical protein